MYCSVLIVDDDVNFRNLSARLLRSWGHTVIGEATDVREGLRLAVSLQPDMVIADLALPDGDGFELARLLRALSLTMSIVLVSSDPDPTFDREAVRAGAGGFVAKDEFSDTALRAFL